MGLLDSVIGGVLGQVLGGNGSKSGSAMSPLVKALLMLLLAKGASGGLGDILGRLGGPRSDPEPDRRRPPPGNRETGDDGDIGGFDQYGGGSVSPSPRAGGGEFGDLAGMLDGPGGGTQNATGAGPYANLDHDTGESADLGGLDGLVERFRHSGLGDVVGSWIGHGGNHPVQPNQLADALGSETLDTLERQTGMDRGTLLTQLAQVLPEVIDKLTPQGRIPDPAERRGW